MSCPACGHQNRAGAKFCEECAAPLKRVCAGCGAELRPTAKFCDECATPVAGPAAATRPSESASTRKVVTIVFADLVGSTALHERLDPESVRGFMESYYDAMRGAVEAHGGRVTQLLGDGVKAVFGAPRVAEDDAIRAVRAAVAMQEAFRALAEQRSGAVGKTGLRVAVNTGEVVADDETEIIGDPVNVAARLQEQGGDGDVVIGGSTQQLVETLVTLAPLGTFSLKGRSEAVAAFRVVSLEPPAGAAAAPFVGRGEELARIRAVFDAAVSAPAARMAVLLGSPGLGKSRLIEEFGRRLGDGATVVVASCEETGSASFTPLAEALRELLGVEDATAGEALRAAIEAVVPVDEAERARIVSGIGALLSGSPASPEETFFVVRRLLGAFAARQPLVLVVDDLQWAEPLLIDLVEHLVQWGSGVPLLVLVGARPELRDKRSSLASPGGLVSDVFTLTGLDAGAAMRLAANVIGAADLPAAVAARVLATSEGNPLFVGELVRMLVHEGALKQEGERWITGVALAALEMPPTIHALLAARIERLRAEERAVLECAAVVGRHFSRGAVAALLPEGRDDLDTRLEALRRSELIESDAGWFLGEPALRFHHVLIRDAAYRRLLKGRRAELHTRIGDWIERRAPDAVEHEETLGWHLEQAHALLQELGPLDDAGRALGARASKHLASAGRRALARDDVPLAASLLRRALARLEAADPARPDLALDGCEALLAAGDVGPAAAAIEELGQLTAGSERLQAWHACFVGQLTALTAPQALHETADRVEAAAQTLAGLGDVAGEAKAHSVHAQALARLGRVGDSEAALDRALAAARRAGDRRRANAVLAGAPLAALWGPSPVTRASGRCLDVVRVLRITQGAPAVESVALSCQGVLEALRGRIDAGRRMIASSRKMVEELGIAHRLFETDVFAGRVDLLEGDAPPAEQRLRGAFEGLRDLGLGIDAAQAAALLARALLAQGRVAEAEALSHESETLAGDDLQAAIAWRGVRAEALARRGEHASAVALAQAAVEIAAATDALLDHADARLALAAALRAAGRSAEAAAEERRTIELWEAKGATLLAERARGGEQTAAAPAASGPAERIEAATRVRRPVRANAATRCAERTWAAVRARDEAALGAEHVDGLEVVHHPSGAAYGKPEMLALFRALWRTQNLNPVQEVLATLGDALVLVRRAYTHDGSDSRFGSVGPVEMDFLGVIEVDAQGRATRSEIFAGNRLVDAVVCLYARRAAQLPAGPERERMAAAARSLEVAMRAPDDLDALATALADDAESRDHRRLGTWSFRGRDAVIEQLRGLHDVAERIVLTVQEILALGPDALLTRQLHAGTDRMGGGRYERPYFMLFGIAADGRIARVEYFDPDPDAEAEALARFAALAGEGSSAPTSRSFQNAASRADRGLFERFNARDWPGIEALAAPELVFDERRRMLHNTCGRDVWLEQFRLLFDVPASRFTTELLATRGERLALSLHRFAGEVAGGGGPLAMDDHLVLHQVDGEGRIVAIVLFDLEDADAAWAELDAHFAAGEGAAIGSVAGAVSRGIADRDWDGLAALCAPTLVEYDHRRVAVLGTTRGPEAWLQNFRVQLDLAPDTLARHGHIEGDARGFLFQVTWEGSREGGGYEIPLLGVVALDAQRRMERIDLYDPEQLGAARARFAEIASQDTPAQRFENAAVRLQMRVMDLWRARDWPGVEQLLSADLRVSDRRSLVQLELDRDGWIELARNLGDMRSAEGSLDLLATRGERLVLSRVRIDVAEGDVGPSRVEHLNVFEASAQGDRLQAGVRFDADDLDTALAELDARWQKGEAAAFPLASAWVAEFRRAFAERDWQAMAALAAPEQVAENHRLVGWGTLRGDRAWLPTLVELVELTPDVRLRIDHLRCAERGILWQGAWEGTRFGGPFETPFLFVAELDENGRQTRLDVWEPEQLEDAWARFDAIAAPASRAPRAALGRPNAASAAMERWQAAFDAGFESDDWAAVRATCAPDFVFDDRRRLALLSGDAELMIASARERVTTGARIERRRVGAAGDHVVIERVLWSGGPAEGRFEIEYLAVAEVDASGLLTAILLFDLQDARAAQREAWARWSASEPELAPTLALIGQLADAFNDHDRARVRALCVDDLAYHDHRRTGVGRIDGADAAIASIEAYWVLAAGQQLELGWHWPACGRHGAVTVVRRFGTLPDGGSFESEYLELFVHARGRVTHLELFELQDFDAALARFEALRPDPLRIPANAATRAIDRITGMRGLVASKADASALRALVTDDFSFDDRGRRSLVRGGVEDWLRALEFLFGESGARIEAELVATRGDRLALSRYRIRESPGAAPFEIEGLRLVEVDAEGRLRALVLFDADDRAAATDELSERWFASDTDQSAWMPVRIGQAWNAHDAEGVRVMLADDFVFHDHRRAGLGRLAGAEAYLPSLRAIWELSADVRLDTLHTLESAPHGSVLVNRTWGTNREGGEFESVYIALSHQAGGRIAGIELFELEDVDAALARFEALRPDPLRIPPNAATRALDAIGQLRGDAAALRALAAPDFRFDDRKRRSLVRGGVDEWLRALAFLATEADARPEQRLLATAGERLALHHVVWRERRGERNFEIEGLRIIEVDAEGRPRALVLFDADDRAAAHEELFERWAASDPEGLTRPMIEFLRAVNAQDLERTRAVLAEDFVFHDHLRAGLGRIEGVDAYLASRRALLELSADSRLDVLYEVAATQRGRVTMARRWGTNAEGGDFETVFASLTHLAHGKLAGIELFEPEDLDAALARLEALSA